MAKKDSEIYSGRMLKDTTVAEKKEDNLDPVGTIVKSAMGDGTAKYRGESLPSLKPEHVEARVSSLLSNKTNNPLPVAVEIVNYYRMELLEEEKAIEALNKLFNADDIGEGLLSTNEGDRLAAIKQFLGGDSDEEDL